VCTSPSPAFLPGYRYQRQYRLADVYRHYWKAYIGSKSRQLFLEDRHFYAVSQSLCCRTGKLGYHLFACAVCEEKKYLYHSCKHRFCGSCGVAETYRWAQARLTQLLDIKHHHVVFTLPAGLRPLAKQNSRLVYDLMFRCSSEVLQDWFAYKHGLKCGIVSVLHTAGSDLKYHPHLHLIVSGGGVKLADGEVVELPKDYLCHVQHLKRRFRWLLERGLIALFDQGKLQLSGSLVLGRPYLLGFLKQLNQKQWVVSVQPPLRDRAQIIGYVGRYTKRACLSEYRLEQVEDGLVSFRFKDYHNSLPGQKPREAQVSLSANEFLDRLLQHVPPKGYRMVRYYGTYAQASKVDGQAGPITAEAPRQAPDFSGYATHWQEVYGEDALQCRHCQQPFSYRGQYFGERRSQRWPVVGEWNSS
jgi:hypothetical protein